MGLFSFSLSSSMHRYHGGYGGAYYRSGLFSSFSSSKRKLYGYDHGYGHGYGTPHPASVMGAASVACPKCGSSVPAGSKFCLQCGEKMEADKPSCKQCGNAVPLGAKFCPSCGGQCS